MTDPPNAGSVCSNSLDGRSDPTLKVLPRYYVREGALIHCNFNQDTS